VSEVVIEISWPSVKLMPNRAYGRSWVSTYAARQQYRAEGYAVAREKLTPGCCPSDAHYSLRIVLHAPDKRVRDLDGLFGALKNALDGIADALGVNDSHFAECSIVRGEPVKGGRVVINISKLPDNHSPVRYINGNDE